MRRTDRPELAAAWARFVAELVPTVDTAWRSTSVPQPTWEKDDGSPVTALDLELDVRVRTCVSRHFPDAAVLSEETGWLRPPGNNSAQVAIVDPVDGTDSLIAGRDSWWVSVGLVDDQLPVAGVIYQPSSGRLHDSLSPEDPKRAALIVGMSPDRLWSRDTSEMRARLVRAGATLVELPHAVEKIAAVLEGRAAASIYLPSGKSPNWHSWDLAAGAAIAAANGLPLLDFDGAPLSVDSAQTTYTSAWLCASNRSTWNFIRSTIGP